MRVKDDCNLWYNRIGDFFMSVRERRQEILFGKGLACKVSQNNLTLECDANATIAMAKPYNLRTALHLNPKVSAQEFT